MRDQFWELPLEALDQEEWEALCDRCGKCCLIKLEDEDSGEIAYTTLACKLFDGKSCSCGDYSNRMKFVDDCLRLTMANIPKSEYWLPKSCAYVRRFHGEALPEWHYLITGSFDSMHKGNYSVKGKTTSEEVMSDLEDAVVYISWEMGP